MRQFVTASIAALALLAQGAMAQEAQEDKGVPVVRAPYHLPVISNEYVTMLKIFIPPNRTSGFHIHDEDSVSVNIMPADMSNQALGSTQITRGERAIRGRAAYTAYSGGPPRTHKATNVGATPFHNVSFIFKQPAGRFTPSTRAEAPAYVQIMDNERVRGWRVVLEPGKSVPAITQTAPGLRIVVDGGELVETIPGQPDRGWDLQSGEFFWQDQGVTRAVRNNGPTRIEMVEFELK